MAKRKHRVKRHRMAVLPGTTPSNPYIRISVPESDAPAPADTPTATTPPTAAPVPKQKKSKKALAIAGGVVGGVVAVGAAVAGAVHYTKNRPTNTISWHEDHPDVHTSSLNDAILGTRDWNY